MPPGWPIGIHVRTPGKCRCSTSRSKKYSLDLSEYLHPTRLSAHNFQLTQDLCRSYNATGITEDIYIPQNIQLMQALRPDLQEIAVIGDCQFFGIYSTLLVKNTFRNILPI